MLDKRGTKNIAMDKMDMESVLMSLKSSREYRVKYAMLFSMMNYIRKIKGRNQRLQRVGLN